MSKKAVNKAVVRTGPKKVTRKEKWLLVGVVICAILVFAPIVVAAFTLPPDAPIPPGFVLVTILGLAGGFGCFIKLI